jgi:hypothetical protein
MLHRLLPESGFIEWLRFANWQDFFKRLTLSELRGKTLRLVFFGLRNGSRPLGRISELGFRFVPVKLHPEWLQFSPGRTLWPIFRVDHASAVA